MYNRRYKSLLKMYDYLVINVTSTDMRQVAEERGYTHANMDHMIVYMNRGEKYLILADVEGYITVMTRNHRFKAHYSTGLGRLAGL